MCSWRMRMNNRIFACHLYEFENLNKWMQKVLIKNKQQMESTIKQSCTFLFYFRNHHAKYVTNGGQQGVSNDSLQGQMYTPGNANCVTNRHQQGISNDSIQGYKFLSLFPSLLNHLLNMQYSICLCNCATLYACSVSRHSERSWNEAVSKRGHLLFPGEQ